MATLDDLNYQPEMVSPWKTGSKWGAIGAGVGATVGLILFLMEASQNQIGIYIDLLIIIVFIRQAIIEHRDMELNHRITYGRAFSIGTISTLVFTLLSTVWALALFMFIAPGLVDEFKEATFNDMLKSGRMDSIQAEEAMDMMSFMFTPSAFAFIGFFYHLTIGIVISAFAAWFVKKNA